MLFIALCFTLQRYKKNRRFPNKLEEIFINLLILTIGLMVEQLGSQMVGCWWGVGWVFGVVLDHHPTTLKP